jgi:putative ABC transport system permease protein
VLILRLVLRALRWRAAASITVFAVAAVAVLSATVGPIYLHTTDQVVLTQRLQESAPADRNIQIRRDTLVGVPSIDWQEPVNRFAGQAADHRWFGRPVVAEQLPMTVRSGRQEFASRLVALDGQCAHLIFTAGRCVRTPEETVVSAKAASAAGWHVGERVMPRPENGNLTLPVTIVGIYRPAAPTGTYWSAWHFFDGRPTLYDNTLSRLDTFFVDKLLLTGHITAAPQTITASIPLVVSRVGLDDRAAVRGLVRSVRTAVADDAPREALSPVKVNTRLDPVITSMNREMSLARTLVTLATVQLALLAICVLYALVAATASVHGPEVALAKLRGRRPIAVLGQALLEPALLIVSAAAAGTALAWVVVRLVAHRLIAPDASVTLSRAALEVAVLATAAALLAAVVAARRIVVAAVVDLLRRGSDSAAPSTGLAVADAVAVAIALAGLTELAASGVLDNGRPDPLSVLAPALLAIAVAIVGLRLLPFAGRAVVRWTRESRHIVTFLTVRQIVRRSAGTRLVLLISIALALATFAVANWSVARSNRHVRAMNETGAARVLTVTPDPGVDIRGAVDRADPDGHQAMAAALIESGNTPLLALDTTRMAGIAAWRPDYSKSSRKQIVARLRPPTAPSVLMSGQEVRVGLNLRRAVTGNSPVLAALTVSDAAHRQSTVDLGILRRGPARYHAALPPDCATGCRLTGVDVEPASTDTARQTARSTIDVQMSDLEVADAADGPWRRVDAGLTDSQRWRAGGYGEVTTRAGALDLNLQFDTTTGQWPVAAPADVPAPLPAVLGEQTASLYPSQASANASATGLDGNSVTLDGSVKAATLPQLDRFGAMVDLTMAERTMTEPWLAGTRFQVWLASSAPGALTRRLQQQGLHVTAVDDMQRHLTRLDHTGPAYADSLFVVAAGAATVLAIGATVLGGLVTARRRSYELAALEAVGVAPRSLRRATATEQGLLLAIGLVLGVLAGVVGARLALPSTPFFVSTDVGPPVESALPGVTLAALGAALLVLLALTCAAMARVIEAQASAGRLREAQQ